MASTPTGAILTRCSIRSRREEDVQRRDFTINGLLMDPLDGDRVLDFVGGRADLAAGIVRAIGDPERRFQEDKLRMLRAVRFAARFGYVIDPPTFAAIKKLAPGIHQVSRERVRDELTKMLTEGHARRAFELLDSTGLLQEVLPEIARMHGVEQPPQFHPEGDVWVHTMMLLEQLPPDARARWPGARCCTMSASPRRFGWRPTAFASMAMSRSAWRWRTRFAQRLHFSNDDTEQIEALVANHMRFSDVERMKASTLKKFLRLPNFDEHMELHRMDCLAATADLALYELRQREVADDACRRRSGPSRC